MISTKKILVISLAALMIIVLSGCGKTDTKDTIQKGNTNESVVGTIKDLLGRNESQKCTWKGSDGETSVIYTDGKKSRVEISGMPDQLNKTMLSINDSQWNYSWMDGDKEGTKFNLKDMEEMAEGFEEYDTEEGDEEFFDEKFEDFEEQEGKYSCDKWKADSSFFVPPSNVNFVDMAEQFKAMEEAIENFQSPEFKESMKAICDLLPAEEKEECLKDFK